LFEERARRILATIAVFTAIGFAVLSFFVWLLASMSLIASRHDLSETLDRTEYKTIELMNTVERLRNSPMRQQLEDFANINDGLLNINGMLEIYEIKDKKTRWRATVPSNVTADPINQIGGKTIETKPEGVIIGNGGEIEYEATAGKK
jgi:hypothetical protein